MSRTCFVFDLDDTLYPERDFVRSGFAAADDWLRCAHGVDGLAEAAWAAFERGVRGTTFDVALAELNVSPSRELIAALVAVYRRHSPKLRLAPDAAACLDALEGRASLALVTDGPWRTQANKLRALGLDGRFEPAVLTGRLSPGFEKPHPRAFELVASRTQADELVYVADNPAKDFLAPRRLGWRTVRIRRPAGRPGGLYGELYGGLYADLQPAPGAEPDVEIDDLRALAPALAGRA